MSFLVHMFRHLLIATLAARDAALCERLLDVFVDTVLAAAALLVVALLAAALRAAALLAAGFLKAAFLGAARLLPALFGAALFAEVLLLLLAATFLPFLAYLLLLVDLFVDFLPFLVLLAFLVLLLRLASFFLGLATALFPWLATGSLNFPFL